MKKVNKDNKVKSAIKKSVSNSTKPPVFVWVAKSTKNETDVIVGPTREEVRLLKKYIPVTYTREKKIDISVLL